MSKEFIIENNIAQIRYSSQSECLADKSKETREFLKSTPSRKAKVPGELVIFRRSKRGGRYILIHLNEYDINYEAIDTEWMSEMSREEIKEFFNPEIVQALDLIDNKTKNRLDFTVRDIQKIYKKAISRARSIEQLSKFKMDKFDLVYLPEFMKSTSCRTKVFITPNLRSKIGG